MPGYAGTGKATLLNYNQQGVFWQNEAVVVTNQSVAFQLERARQSFYPWGAAVEVAFSGAPGAFEVDILAAETDKAANYVKVGSITTVNASNVGRLDLTQQTPFYGKYISLVMVTLTNVVTTTAVVSR